MNQFIIKNFRKNDCVKLYLIKPDKRIKEKYVIPNGKSVTIDDMTFELVESKMFYSNSIPTFICSYKSAEVVDPSDIQNIQYDPKYYNTALSAKIADEIFRVTDNKIDMQMISVILSLLCLLGLVFLYITFSDQLTNIINQLNPPISPSETTTEMIGGM